MSGRKDSSFLENVFPAELEEIAQRRRNADLDDEGLSGKPTTENELVGLALSGGGIRSATFSLGVIQGLCKHGLLKRVDYLSTVSGGGYMGSCVSNLLNDPDNDTSPEQFPLRYTEESGEPPALTHLRNCSNYLAPQGLLPKLRLPNLMLRGILMNLFVFLPFIMALVFATEIAYEKGPHWDLLPKWVLPLIVIFIFMAVAFPFLVRMLRRYFNWQRRNAYELALTIPLLLAGILLLMVPFLHVTRLAIEHSTVQFMTWLSHLHPLDIWKGAVITLAVIGVFMMAGKASENVNKIYGKLVLGLIGLLGPAIIYAIYLMLCLWQIDSPFLNVQSTVALNEAVECSSPCLSTEAARAKAAEHRHEEADGPQSFTRIMRQLFEPEQGAKTIPQLVSALQGRTLQFDSIATVSCKPSKDKPFGNKPCNLAHENLPWQQDERVWLIDNAPDANMPCPELEDWREQGLWQATKRCTYLTRTSNMSLRIEGAQLHLFDSSEDYWFFAILLGLFLFNRLFLDINITSPHGFYRDRLSKAYLFRFGKDREIEPDDHVPLAGLNAAGSVAPYHVINVTLNLQGSSDPDLRGRESDFFIFSKRYTGSDRTGYSETRVMESMDRHLDLATAIAVSGAAAAPNMGTTTNRSLTFIMTLLNVRLGYWLPNPAFVNRDFWFKRLALSSAKPTLILKEAMGRLNAKGSHVNISDGGHLENLAIYPLLKRKCKFIIAVDGEADPFMAFNGLVTTMRFARIDMGIEIEMDLDGLRKDASGNSEVHSTLGTIHYANGETGHLLYFKLSVTGDEPEYVSYYRANNPAFPHESTADQFFSEDQFEAYRALGEHVSETRLRDRESLGPFLNLSSDK